MLFEPLISPALWITLALAASGLLVFYAFSRPGRLSVWRWSVILALMGLGMAAVLVILLNPTWVQPIPPPAGKPVLTVLVDSSESMGTADISEGKSRYQAASEAAAALADQLSSRFDVRTRSFASSTKTTEPSGLANETPTGASTDLAMAISSALEENHPQGQAVVILSDGVHNAAGGVERVLENVRTAKAMSVPIFTSVFGGDTVRNDIEVEFARPKELSFVGQKVPLTAVVRQRGFAGAHADVVLSHDGKEIARQTVHLAGDRETPVHFSVTQRKSGLFRYEVRVEPLNGEVTEVNNSRMFVLRVVDEPIRVLVLEGKPYWDGKFLMRTLSSDPSVEVDCVIRLTEDRYLKRKLRLAPGADLKLAARPVSDSAASNQDDSPDTEPVVRVETTTILDNPKSVLEEGNALEGYQVIVLGRDSEVFLTDIATDRLRSWIARDGGSLVCYRGSPVAQVNQNLARLLPVHWSPSREARFRVRLTERGEGLNWLANGSPGSETNPLGRLPSLAAVATAERPKPMAVVLAASEGDQESPAVVYQPYGIGRVVTLEGAGMWRWAFLSPEYREHDAVYSSIWQSLLRWLVSSIGLIPGEEMVLRDDQVAYTQGEPVSATLLVREETARGPLPKIELEQRGSPDVRQFTPIPLGDEPGVYQVDFGRLDEGRYEARIAGQESQDVSTSLAFDVRKFLGEQLDVAARADLMGRIASDSGGIVVSSSEPGEIAERFEQHLNESRPPQFRKLSAWDRWWVLIGTLALWTTAWGVRRSSGLV